MHRVLFPTSHPTGDPVWFSQLPGPDRIHSGGIFHPGSPGSARASKVRKSFPAQAAFDLSDSEGWSMKFGPTERLDRNWNKILSFKERLVEASIWSSQPQERNGETWESKTATLQIIYQFYFCLVDLNCKTPLNNNFDHDPTVRPHLLGWEEALP